MRSIHGKLSTHALVRAIIFIAVGVLMIIYPGTVANVIVYILACYVVLLGIIDIVNFILCREHAGLRFNLVSGIVLVLLGAAMVFFSGYLVALLPILLGVIVIVSSAISLVQVITYGRATGNTRVPLIILDVLLVLGGVVILLNPFESIALLFIIFGIITVVLGISELITFFIYRGADKLSKE